jgi:hypothetical protein
VSVLPSGSPRSSDPSTTGSAMRLRYRAYGLVFASSLPIPEMAPVGEEEPAWSRPPDVTVTTGEVPLHLRDPIRSGEYHEANADRLLLRIPGVGRYLVAQGERIIIEPHPEASDHEVRVFLLGSSLGALLHQRGYLVLHASGIGTDQGAVLFAGASGAGKSTLLAELLRRGHRMMVDDVCAVTMTSEAPPLVVPSYPRTRLWGETAGRLAIDVRGLTRTRPNMDKYERQVVDQFWDSPAPLARLYHLAGSSGDEMSLRQLGPLEAFQTVLNNTYRPVLLDSMARRGAHFELASRLSCAAPVVRVIRPRNTFRLEDLADLILEDVRNA